MAKKVLTPEQQEIKAIKKQKKSQNWTKFWAIVLALALTLGVAYLGKSQGKKNVPEVAQAGPATNQSSDSQNTNTDDPAAPADPAVADDPAVAPTPAADGDKAEKPAADAAQDEASVAALINKVTGEAVAKKVGYDWVRKCAVKDIDVGKLTGPLNKLIGGISEGADIDSVVGGFLGDTGDGDSRYTVKKGETLDTLKVTKDDGTTEPYYHGNCYTLKATALKAEDIKNLKINGNQYSFTLPDCQDPNRSGNVALSRFTNDIVVLSEVESELQNFTKAVSISRLQTNYKNIKCTVTIKDNKLVELTYSFYADAELDIKLGLTITGTGNLTTSAKYSNFKY